MKKIISFLLCFCLVMTVLSTGIVTAFAEGTAIENTDVTWSFNEETAELSFDGTGEIPDYDTYKDEFGVVDPSYPWSEYEYKSISFGEGITRIGNFAFCYSPALESVVIPETVTALGKGVFMGCGALKSATVNAAAAIGDNMFSLCDELSAVTFGTATTAIGTRSFYRCASIEAVTLPASLTAIGDSAFALCTGLSGIEIPEGVTAVGGRCFYDCEALEAATLPSTLETIGASAFDGCAALKELAIPDLITTIPANLCNGCRALESVTLPASVKVIADGAFSLCDSLKAITVPATINTIGEKALGYGQWNLPVEGFTITGYENSPAKDYALANGFNFVSSGYITSGVCGEGVTWEYNEETKTLSIKGTGAMEDFAKDKPSRFACIPYEIVEIEDTVTRIGAYAFYNAGAISFTLNKDLTEIGEKAIGFYADEEGNDALREGTTITCYEDTVPHAYATENGVAFNSLGKFIVTTGELGEGVIWTYEPETKTITVSGEGAIKDFSEDALAEFADYDIEAVVVQDGITAIGDYALSTTKPYNELFIARTVMSIGENAFGFVRTEILDEELNPTGEIAFIPNGELEVTGYLFTPADEYSRAYEFIFLPLDAELCRDLRFGAPSTVDYVNNYIYLYAFDPDTEAVLGTLDLENIQADLPESIKTGAQLSVIDPLGTTDFTFVLYGDANCDGKTNSNDALIVLMNSVKLYDFESEAQALACDINHDGKVNSIDALIILQIKVGKLSITDLYNPGEIR